MSSLQVVIAQINPMVGDIPGNTEQLIAKAREAEAQGADVVVFSELGLLGYPPEDLVLRPSVKPRVARALEVIEAADLKATVIFGYPKVAKEGVYNAAGVVQNGRLVAEYAKQHLPNYRVFDDKRYFVPGDQPCVVKVGNMSLGVVICEDLWHYGPAEQAVAAGAEVIVSLNASPFHANKLSRREEILIERARSANVPIIYAHQSGAQDELVFDGESMAVDETGALKFRAPAFEEGLYQLQLHKRDADALPQIEGEICGTATNPQTKLAKVYRALVVGVRDYINKNRFPGVVLGLSGGIDSALTLAIAADALGSERVEAVMMPYHYTSSMSQEDAAAEAEALGVAYQVIDIAPMVEAFQEKLAPAFAGLSKDTTEENLQARCRGTLLMALSNKKGSLVLTTGNKSEMAVGYATLYGDMAGGFAVLKDVWKTLVFELSEYRNSISPVIPQRVIDRPPSAELAPDQVDEDSLPPYSELDKILKAYIEEDKSADTIIAAGFAEEVVHKVLRLVDINEYKRRQAAIGPRVTERGFGRDRRYPITSGWKIGE